jgi:hypothetical protein
LAENYNVTSVGSNPREDRAHRMRFYYIAMAFRVLCVISLFWIRSWWSLIPIIGAAVLPYLAVMVGNAIAGPDPGQKPEQVTPPELLPPRENIESGDDHLIVVDAPADRRASATHSPDTFVTDASGTTRAESPEPNGESNTDRSDRDVNGTSSDQWESD